jgi:transcription elongation factor GreA
MKRIRFTQQGYDSLQAQYKDLIQRRKPAVLDLTKAREMGDLKENGYYRAARSNLNSIDHQIRTISHQLKNAFIIDVSNSSIVDVGAQITLKNDKEEVTYSIVGDLESNPLEKKISLLSPIGKAVMGKREGDEISIQTPSGNLFYTLIKIA